LEAASKRASRLFYIAIASSLSAIILFHLMFQYDVVTTMDDSVIAPHLFTSNFRTSGAKVKKEGLSACLLVNDENPRLPEWIAYHYHVLPLRSLIVAIDPASRHQPTEILSRWAGMGVEIDTWNDTHYLGNDGGVCNSTDSSFCTTRHLWRQMTFISRCMTEFKQRNKTWVLLTDVDEYISSDLLDWGEGRYGTSYNPTNNSVPEVHMHKTIRDIIMSQGTMAPCLPITRLLFGTKEDYNSNWKDISPTGFDEFDFVTLRFRWRAMRNKVFVNRWQKTIIDVSRIPLEDLQEQAEDSTIHLPLPKHCPRDPRAFRTTLLRAVSLSTIKSLTCIIIYLATNVSLPLPHKNHYLDSFEAYSYRKDARAHARNFEKWESKSKDAADEMDMDLTPWLKGFVRNVGYGKAKMLLDGTGKFENNNSHIGISDKA
ncbi:hypothetical protein ACHAW6_004965, partial [Cyclotella cf. meneghiniana]